MLPEEPELGMCTSHDVMCTSHDVMGTSHDVGYMICVSQAWYVGAGTCLDDTIMEEDEEEGLVSCVLGGGGVGKCIWEREKECC